MLCFGVGFVFTSSTDFTSEGFFRCTTIYTVTRSGSISKSCLRLEFSVMVGGVLFVEELLIDTLSEHR